jgi:1,4-dihydroxy-2-naphthoate octaprenyltransferase
MENGSSGVDRTKSAPQAPSTTRDETQGVTRAATPSGEPLPDARDFFRSTTKDAVASYAKDQAQRRQSTSIVAAWARAARLSTVLWALLSVAIAGTYVWARNYRPQIDRLLIVALASMALIIGVNLLRGAARDVAIGRIAGTTLRTTLAARVSIIFFALTVVLGLVTVRWIGTGGVVLGLLGVALGALPGDELIPALALGPGLFFFALVTQKIPVVSTVIIKAHPQSITTYPNFNTTSAWLIALGLGAIFLAPIIASRLRVDLPPMGRSTTSYLGVRVMRMVLVGSIIAAYVLVLASGLSRHESHASIAVLLSLPVAILPVTGMLVARNASARYIVLSQTQMLAIQFCLWLFVGLLLGGFGVHYLTDFHLRSH